MQEDVIGFEHGVRFEFPAPVAIGVLLGEKELTAAHNGRFNIRQVRIQAPEFGHNGLRIPLFALHTFENASTILRPSRTGGRGRAVFAAENPSSK
jgi:hypothetical protein